LGTALSIIVEAVDGLKVRSCLIDGEAVACDENGLAVFERLRYRQRPAEIFLYAFVLLYQCSLRPL